MFKLGQIFLSFWQMTRGVGSHRPWASTPGLQGPGARGGVRGLVLQAPHLGWFSVGLRRLEEARARGFACCVACSRLLTRSILRSLGGPGVRSRSASLVGQLYNGRVAVARRVPWHGCRRPWCTMVPPTRGTPVPFRPLHARPVWRWPACLWSVSGQVVVSAAVWLVLGCVSRLIVGLFAVGSFSLQLVLAHLVVVHVVVSVGTRC